MTASAFQSPRTGLKSRTLGRNVMMFRMLPGNEAGWPLLSLGPS